MIGKTISHYKIIKEIGQGGMGVVYKAEDTKLKRTVALKFLPPELTRDPEAKKRFLIEAQAAAALDHPNICDVHEIDEVEGQTFIVIGFIEGQSLKEKIDSGPLKIDEALDIGIQIAEGLHAAHDHGIVHRDIKPANIMITKEGRVKILDFGLAKLTGLSQLTKAGATLGTTAYMSPEQARGEPADQRTDIWSLGVVLYEMVTGQLPFKGEYEQAILYSILNEQPEPPTALRSGVPMDLERIILKMLAKNPNERYQHLDEVVTDLNALKKHTTQPAIPMKPLRSTRRKLRKVGIISLLATLLIIVILLVVKYFFTGQLEASAPKPIAVISFENQTGNPQYDYLKTAIPNLLISKLEQSHLLRVTTWERMHDLLVQMGRPKVETIDKNLGFELCRRDSVHFIVLGSFTKAGNVFATDVKVLDVRSKQLLKSASARGDGAASILKSQIDQLSEQIVAGIGLSSKTERKELQTPVSEITTSSMEAYQYYLKALEAFKNGRFKNALQFSQQALKLDSTFALGYISLYLSSADPRVQKEALIKAHTYAYKAEKKWQYWINGFYALKLEHNIQKCFEWFKKMADAYPREKTAQLTLAWMLYRYGEMDKAVPYLKRALQLDPQNVVSLFLLGYIYLHKKHSDQAFSYFQKYIQVKPNEPNPYDCMGDLFFSTGRLSDAISWYRQALEKDSTFSSARKIVYLLGIKENYSSAMTFIDRYFLNKNSNNMLAQGHLLRGSYLYWLGQIGKALDELSTAQRLAEAQQAQVTSTQALWLKIWVLNDQKRFNDVRQKVNQWYTSITMNQSVNMEFFYKLEKQFALGFIDLKKGIPDSVQIHLALMENYLKIMKTFPFKPFESSVRKRAKFHYLLLKGEFLYQQNSTEAMAVALKAIRLIHQLYDDEPTLTNFIYANFPFHGDILARLYQKEGKISQAIQEYEKLMEKDEKIQIHFLIHPLYHFRLAKLYEEKGWVGKALEQYQKFLDLTRNADEFLQQRKDAKARYARLKGT